MPLPQATISAGRGDPNTNNNQHTTWCPSQLNTVSLSGNCVAALSPVVYVRRCLRPCKYPPELRKHVLDRVCAPMSCLGDQVNSEKMYASHRRVLQTVSLAALLAYSALLAYQTLSRGLVDEEVKYLLQKIVTWV